MYEHNALGYWSGLALCLTKVRSSRARCPATALIHDVTCIFSGNHQQYHHSKHGVHKDIPEVWSVVGPAGQHSVWTGLWQ